MAGLSSSGLRPWSPSPRSTLGLLYMWAAAGGHENFCTEALVAAIRGDLGQAAGAMSPVGRILGAIQAPVGPSAFLPVAPVLDGREVQGVETQVVLKPDGGILDVAIDMGGAELWVEVKTGSPEGVAVPVGPDDPGLSQLDTYNDRAKALMTQDRRDRAVILLSPTRLRPDVPWLPWSAIHAAARAPGAASGWSDLARCLEETQVTNDQLEPIRAAEAASMTAAAGLLRKVREVMWVVHQDEIRGRGFTGWATRGGFDNALAQQLVDDRLVLHSEGWMPGRIGWGATSSDGEAWWVVIVSDRKVDGPLTRAHRQLWQASPGLGEVGWSWNDAVPDVVVKTIRVVEASAHRDAVAWFRAAFSELDAAGILAPLRPVRQAPTEETPAAT